jgi:hypothetical protein
MPRGRKKPSADGDALIDWHDPERNVHLLDWRARAREFGVEPIEPTDSRPLHVMEPPDQLIDEEEQEAYQDQTVRGPGEEVEESPALGDAEEATLPADEVDLVRVYFQNIGKRKLLKKEQEQEICRKIEMARAELLSNLGAIPAASRALLALADEVKRGGAQAAELILLPDGGRRNQIEPVLNALARVHR